VTLGREKVTSSSHTLRVTLMNIYLSLPTTKRFEIFKCILDATKFIPIQTKNGRKKPTHENSH
jgi:hypothetical protein